MKLMFSAGSIICLVLVGGAVGMAKSHGQPETVLTETVLAKRDHLKVLSTIGEMCTDKSVATNHDSPVRLVSVRAFARQQRGGSLSGLFAKTDDVPDGG